MGMMDVELGLSARFVDVFFSMTYFFYCLSRAVKNKPLQ